MIGEDGQFRLGVERDRRMKHDMLQSASPLDIRRHGERAWLEPCAEAGMSTRGPGRTLLHNRSIKPQTPPSMSPLFLVDGFNFLHAVVLKGRDRARWWSAENRARVVEVVAGLGGGGAEMWVVFDERGRTEPPVTGASAEQAVPVHYAPNADDYIVALCAELAGGRDVIVVSADRSLIDRARHRGARGLSPWAFAAGQCRAG
jgi:hypothetical protein